MRTRCLLSLLLLSLSITADLQARDYDRPIPGLQIFRPACDSIESYMSRRSWSEYPIFVKSAYVTKGKKPCLVIKASRDMAYYPFRDGDIEHIYDIMRDMMPAKYKAYKGRFRIEANNRSLKAYSPAYYSAGGGALYVREHAQHRPSASQVPQLIRLDEDYTVDRGLYGRHIALWHSHGRYFNISNNRWQWQRGRIFGVVEDTFTQSFVIPFLAPMLENAGAVVYMPRERDTNPLECIVDNDTEGSGYSESGAWSPSPKLGFKYKESQYLQGENPFSDGTSRQARAAKGVEARWVPDIPQDGDYAVYISYTSLPTSADDALYEVHRGTQTTRISVNQRIGGGTWLYIGTYKFAKGRNEGQYVSLKGSLKNPKATITADAVRFGGGMGNIARGSSSDKSVVSGHPRFNEAARYYLQWAGFNDSIYSPTKFESDYRDDIKAHAGWVNTLKREYGVPLDLAFAFHTDAGLRQTDSVVGTLAIHTWKYHRSDKYENGERRFQARDYADIVQSQVVNDLRRTFNPQWTRRGLWDRIYGECSAPQVPSMILELLSHQNFNDMRYGLDPYFRFFVSRAVYKGIARYLCWINNTPFTVQPLPVSNFYVRVLNTEGRSYAALSWKMREDPLEASAAAEKYLVQTRIDDGDFDNGRIVEGTKVRIEIEKGKLYSFKVSAINAGGKSFPSEILCAAIPSKEDTKSVLVVNNFTRIAPPSSFISADSLTAGFRYDLDAGVPYRSDISYCGPQYEFRRSEEWQSDDYPGFGASESDYDAGTFAGNTFDLVHLHAKALLRSGYAVVSSSRASVIEGEINLKDYPVIDLLCGKQKRTATAMCDSSLRDYSVFPDALRNAIADYVENCKGALIVSGAYVISDLWDYDDSASIRFSNDILRCRKSASDIKPEGGKYTIRDRSGNEYFFDALPNPVRYHIEKPDGIEPSGLFSKTIFEYDGCGVPAGILVKSGKSKVATLGFPIESTDSEDGIARLVGSLLQLVVE